MTISVWSPGEQINNSLTMTGIGSRKKKKMQRKSLMDWEGWCEKKMKSPDLKVRSTSHDRNSTVLNK